ncbi:hypothetical protein HJG60_012048 [Phyllostomus discolor]|uniref:Uncharacterized protein n=1 Tax=Phyllostomus discolor TaxID=89673 RepID=A0A834DYP4_9CHIR|nr:hypothetical protein HJG60_012048 [Phyllostomus discolor]
MAKCAFSLSHSHTHTHTHTPIFPPSPPFHYSRAPFGELKEACGLFPSSHRSLDLLIYYSFSPIFLFSLPPSFHLLYPTMPGLHQRLPVALSPSHTPWASILTTLVCEQTLERVLRPPTRHPVIGTQKSGA